MTFVHQAGLFRVVITGVLGEKGLTGGSEKASGVFPVLSGLKGLKGTCDVLTACGNVLV